MKKLGFFVCMGLLALAAYGVYPYVLKGAFQISGEVDVAPRLKKYAARPNTVCFVVVKNMGEIPVAVKRFVNPSFPLKFTMRSRDLMLPDSWSAPLKVEVQISNHGQAGVLEAGDMFGKLDKPVRVYADVKLTADKMMGMPSLIASSDKDYMFTSAAR